MDAFRDRAKGAVSAPLVSSAPSNMRVGVLGELEPTPEVTYVRVGGVML